MKYEFDENTKIVHISVREMCEFVFRSGSIYSGGTDISGEAMLKGIALHKKLQKEREKQYGGYKSEYRMQTDEEIDDRLNNRQFHDNPRNAQHKDPAGCRLGRIVLSCDNCFHVIL